MGFVYVTKKKAKVLRCFIRRCEIETRMKKKKNALSRAFKKLILEKLLRRCNAGER
jgi:hypothetical protein